MRWRPSQSGSGRGVVPRGMVLPAHGGSASCEQRRSLGCPTTPWAFCSCRPCLWDPVLPLCSCHNTVNKMMMPLHPPPAACPTPRPPFPLCRRAGRRSTGLQPRQARSGTWHAPAGSPWTAWQRRQMTQRPLTCAWWPGPPSYHPRCDALLAAWVLVGGSPTQPVGHRAGWAHGRQVQQGKARQGRQGRQASNHFVHRRQLRLKLRPAPGAKWRPHTVSRPCYCRTV